MKEASRRRQEEVKRGIERARSRSQRGHRPSPQVSPKSNRPVSRGAMSKVSYSNISRLSIDSNLMLKRRDSYDDIAKALYDIEQRFNTSKNQLY